jgi:hypothetical protein
MGQIPGSNAHGFFPKTLLVRHVFGRIPDRRYCTVSRDVAPIRPAVVRSTEDEKGF